MRPRARGEQRRAHLRFEVRGATSASVLSSEKLLVLNLGANGALVESAVPLPLHAEYRMQLVLAGDVTDATVKVRRVAAVRDARSSRYRIGVEFLAISSEAADVIQRIIAAPPDETLPV